MDGFILRDFLIVFVGVFDWAVFHAGRATRASVLDNVAGLFGQIYSKVSCFPLDAVNFGIRQNFYIWMPADLDQFG